jgi:hypothetical protein
MSRRRSQEIELNFDGLTDAVTNLVGALILLIVLVLGVTKVAGRGATSANQPVPRWDSFAPSQTDGPKPVQPLLRQIELLRRDIAVTDQQMKELELVMDELRQKYREMTKTQDSGTKQ